jgi:hypothetical protein
MVFTILVFVDSISYGVHIAEKPKTSVYFVYDTYSKYRYLHFLTHNKPFDLYSGKGLCSL